MNATKLVAAVMAGLLVSAGVAAALPGNAPDDVPANGNESADDGQEVEDNGTIRPGVPITDNETAPFDPGPPSDAPEDVPAFVDRILATINEFLRGGNDGPLGTHISDLTPGPVPNS